MTIVHHRVTGLLTNMTCYNRGYKTAPGVLVTPAGA